VKEERNFMKLINRKRKAAPQKRVLAAKLITANAKPKLTKRSLQIKARLKRLKQSQIIDQETLHLQFRF
jgi:hypothetical protein